MTVVKLRAIARQTPMRMSDIGAPTCCRWIMSDLAKTVHRPAMRAGLRLSMAMRANSPSMAMPSRSACWSRKAPVPAAQRAFIEKSSSIIWRLPSSQRRERSFESCPPISMIVCASGWNSPTARVCATSSLTCTPPITSAIGPPPEPVRPTMRTPEGSISVPSCARVSSSAPRGRPHDRT